MMGPREIARRFTALLTRRRWERDFDDELSAHIDFAVDEYLRRGLSPQEARRRALVDLGGIEATRQRHREGRGFPGFDALRQDLSFAFRTLRRNPLLTGFALATIALGIGGSVAVFSVVSVPLPFEQADRLVWIQNGNGPTRSHRTIQVDHYRALRERSSAFTELGAYGGFERVGARRLSAPGSPARHTGASVTAGFFPTAVATPRSRSSCWRSAGSRPTPTRSRRAHDAWASTSSREGP